MLSNTCAHLYTFMATYMYTHLYTYSYKHTYIDRRENKDLFLIYVSQCFFLQEAYICISVCVRVRFMKVSIRMCICVWVFYTCLGVHVKVISQSIPSFKENSESFIVCTKICLVLHQYKPLDRGSLHATSTEANWPLLVLNIV